jgi:two-component system LytT family sensor kinase
MLTARTKFVLGTAWLLFWLLMISTAVQDYARNGGVELWHPILWEGSSGVTATLLLLTQRRYTRRHDHLLATPLRWFIRQLPFLLAFWIAFVPIAFGIRHAAYALAGETYKHEAWPQTFLYEDIKISIFFGIFTVILFGVLSYHALLEEKLRAERTNTLLRQAQLLRLQQQMQPHFLFNALNTISSLMQTDVARADATLIQLADVLRATLEVSEQHQAPLETELRLLRGYAHLMSERFADRVAITWRIDEALLSCAVPVMSMQPLLENIFKHTVERRRQATHIVISAAREQDTLVLRLEDDNGTLADTPNLASAGIGLRNLRARLAVLHGEAASFTLTQLAPAGVRAEMRLPCAS